MVRKQCQCVVLDAIRALLDLGSKLVRRVVTVIMLFRSLIWPIEFGSSVVYRVRCLLLLLPAILVVIMISPLPEVALNPTENTLRSLQQTSSAISSSFARLLTSGACGIALMTTKPVAHWYRAMIASSPRCS